VQLAKKKAVGFKEDEPLRKQSPKPPTVMGEISSEESSELDTSKAHEEECINNDHGRGMTMVEKEALAMSTKLLGKVKEMVINETKASIDTCFHQLHSSINRERDSL